MKLSELFQIVSQETLIKYFTKELEHTWRDKFDKIKEVMKKEVDQIRVVIDLRAVTLKQISNK